MTEKLKPCPFCGGIAGSGKIAFKDEWNVLCTNRVCPSIALYSTRNEAVAAWNRRADGWISVEDRLPEPNAWILIYINFGTCGSTAIGRYVELYHSVFVWFNDVLGKKTDLVTHWQPLPAPPAE